MIELSSSSPVAVFHTSTSSGVAIKASLIDGLCEFVIGIYIATEKQLTRNREVESQGCTNESVYESPD